jgi:hypothetical protein
MLKCLEQLPAYYRRAFVFCAGEFSTVGDELMIIGGQYTLEKRLEAI